MISCCANIEAGFSYLYPSVFFDMFGWRLIIYFGPKLTSPKEIQLLRPTWLKKQRWFTLTKVFAIGKHVYI